VRNSAQRQVDDLNKQKESVGAHLAQISQLLGGTMPGIAEALKPSSPQQAVASSPARAVTAGPAAEAAQVSAAAPVRHAAAPAPADAPAKASANGKQGEGDDEWWTE